MTKIIQIALVTYRESIRSKILYSVLLFAGVLVLLSSLLGSVTIGDQNTVIKDFGLMSISIFSIAFAVIAGTTLLSNELSKKTVYNILAKHVYRQQFILGKYLGMLFTVALLVILMGIALSIYVAIFEGHFDLAMLFSYLFIFFELIIICAVAIFFSSVVVTPLLSGLFTFGVFLAGRSAEYFLYFVNSGEASGISEFLLRGLYFILPNLSYLNINNEVVYGSYPSAMKITGALAYSIGYAVLLLILSNIIFKRREFN